jgi:acetyl-CoA acetyltransferase
MTAAIVGIGRVPVGKYEHISPAKLASDALDSALGDAGLLKKSVDGLLLQIGSPRGLDYDVMATQLGLRVGFASQTWSHGRFMATVLQHAAMALDHGLAEVVVCLGVYKNSGFPRHGMQGYPSWGESIREGNGPHGETPSVGMAAPMAGAAMALQRYMYKFSVAREMLGTVAATHRRHAALNPHAFLRSAPLTSRDYEESPYVIEPLRRADCSVPVDVATAAVMVRGALADELCDVPVYLKGFQGISAGPDDFIFGHRGLGVNTASISDEPWHELRVYEHAGITTEDVDGLYLYDAFTSQVWWTLERFGFCPVGEASSWCADGRIDLGGELPVNTNGGMLAEGHTNGWGHLFEIVTQLRDSAGRRQIADAKHLQWATALGDSIIFSNQRG